MKKLVAILVLLTIFSGCIEPQSTSVSPVLECGIYNISVDEAKGLVDSGEMFILDVRKAPEYDAGHLIGSTSIPLSELDDRLDEIPKDEPLLVYCKSGARSTTAAGVLEKNGFCVIYDVDGGFRDWQAADYPYEE